MHIVFGALGLFGALVVLLVFGGIAGIVGISAPHDADAMRAIPILGIVGTVIAVFVLLLSLPGLIAGFGLLRLRPWARILTIVLSALNLLNVPIGTALALMMSIVAISVPEMIILRQVVKWQLLAIFAGVVTLAIIIIGYTFNYVIFPGGTPPEVLRALAQ